jgi:hypothetical protein
MKELLKLFIPIVKIDEEKRTVFGRVTEEVADSSNETFDYGTSKPFYQEWTDYFQKATDGKSYGNLRAMHDGKKASGYIQNLNLDDREKAVEVVAKVVDEEDWKKCLEGVYTGFSQGGRYVKKWFDGKTNRYTAAPNEISLVDYPALKSATFSLVKANGIVEEHPFQKVAERSDVSPKEGEKKYGDVKFADAKNKKYPIDTEAHIRAAWNYINKPKNAAKYSSSDVSSIKSKIVSAWKAKIDKEGPPSAKEESKKIDAMTEDELKKATIDLMVPDLGDLKKYAGEEISDTITAAYCLQSIAYLYEKEMGEEEQDQATALKTVIDNLKAFIASEIQEDFEDGLMQMSQKIEDLQKSGARHSKADGEVLQKIHDHTADMGAECKCNKCNATKKIDPESEMAKSMTKALLAKVQAIHDHTNDLGVECKCAKCNKSDGKEDEEMDLKKLEEITKRQDALEADNKLLKAKNEALEKKLEELSKEPEPAKGKKMDVSTVQKQGDGIKKSDDLSAEKDPLAMLKKAHQNPIAFAVTRPIEIEKLSVTSEPKEPPIAQG